MEKTTEAIVQGIRQGTHGRYVVTTSQEVEGSITFALDSTVWKEDDDPEQGITVILTDIRRKRSGWRAMSARYLRPGD